MRIVSNIALIVLLAAGLVIWFLLPWWALLALLGVLGILLGVSHQGRRTLAILRLGLSTLSQRIGASLVILIGIAGVVGVLVALLAMSEGLTRVLHSTGSPDTAIVLRAGATSELASGLSHSDATLIRQQPGIAHNGKGQPLASPELVVIVNLPKKKQRHDCQCAITGSWQCCLGGAAGCSHSERAQVPAGFPRTGRRHWCGTAVCRSQPG